MSYLVILDVKANSQVAGLFRRAASKTIRRQDPSGTGSLTQTQASELAFYGRMINESQQVQTSQSASRGTDRYFVLYGWFPYATRDELEARVTAQDGKSPVLEVSIFNNGRAVRKYAAPKIHATP